MLLRRRRAAGTTTTAAETAEVKRVQTGYSLARGPALVLGTILLAAGLYFLYKQATFTRVSNFPNGNAPVQRDVVFGIFGVNGWTGELTAVAGGLLLIGAAQHHLAKGMSLFVGACLAAAAIIAAVSGNVLGLAAANTWTKVGWGVAALIALLNALIPRPRREVVGPAGAGATTGGRPLARRRPITGGTSGEREVEEEPTAAERV